MCSWMWLIKMKKLLFFSFTVELLFRIAGRWFCPLLFRKHHISDASSCRVRWARPGHLSRVFHQQWHRLLLWKKTKRASLFDFRWRGGGGWRGWDESTSWSFSSASSSWVHSSWAHHRQWVDGVNKRGWKKNRAKLRFMLRDGWERPTISSLRCWSYRSLQSVIAIEHLVKRTFW